MNQFWTFQCIFLNNFKDILEAYSLSKICKIVLEYTLKCSQLISSSDNKKILLTTRNVRLDSGHYATKYYFFMNDGCASSFIHQIIRMNEAAFNFLCNHRLVHVVWDFRPWDIMTKVCTLFFYASFSIFEPLRRP